MNIVDLTNKIIVITGAGSGIGQQTAITASKVGATVVMLDYSEEGMQDTLSQMDENQHQCIKVDLSQIDNIAPLIKEVIANVGAVHGLVHCAGISSRKPLNMLKREGFDRLMNINFYSFVELVKQITKKGNMVNGGSIAVMSSISSIKGYKAKTEYCVSKASVDAFVRCMALELAPKRIRINSVMAAEVLTPLALKARESAQAVGASEFNAPLGPSETYEVANTICFLLSDATKTITGTNLLIDGGATI